MVEPPSESDERDWIGVTERALPVERAATWALRLALLLRRAVWGKMPGHGINEPGPLRPARSMSMIGA
ncbi:MAG: hypothetical protein ACLQPH_13475 [Acidimicrobiales bacterium]